MARTKAGRIVLVFQAQCERRLYLLGEGCARGEFCPQERQEERATWAQSITRTDALVISLVTLGEQHE